MLGVLEQAQLIDYLLSQINDNEKVFCEPIINNLLDLGYTPEKQIKTKLFVVKIIQKYIKMLLDNVALHGLDKIGIGKITKLKIVVETVKVSLDFTVLIMEMKQGVVGGKLHRSQG
jgi:hypothetical protein